MSYPTYDEGQSNPGISVRDLLHVVFKYQKRILLIFIATIVTVMTVTFLMPPVYESNASILVKLGREYMADSPLGSQKRAMVINSSDLVNSEIQILKSRELIGKVVTSMGVEVLYPGLENLLQENMTPQDAAVIGFSDALAVDSVRGANIITVHFQHQNPEIAVKALDLLIDYFKERHLEVFSSPDTSFLDKQLEEYRNRLTESESALATFKQKYNIFSLNDQRVLLLQQQAEHEKLLRNTRNRVQELTKQVATNRDQLRKISQDPKRYTPTDRDGIVVDAQTRLLNLELEAQELRAKGYRNNGQTMAGVQAEISLVRRFLKTQENELATMVKTGNPVYQEVEKELLKAEAELASLQASEDSLTLQYGKIELDLRSLDEKQNEFRRLERERELNEKNYLTYVEKQEEARIMADLDQQKIASISVIQAPATLGIPVKPKKRINLLIGALVGLLGALGFVFLVEFTSQTFSTPESVLNRLGLPVLASITLKEA